MKKTTKLMISLFMVCISIVVLGFGVWAAVSVSYTVGGTVSFSYNSVNEIYFSLSGNGTGASTAIKSFSYSNTSEMTKDLPNWELGQIYFNQVFNADGTSSTTSDIVITLLVRNESSVFSLFVKPDFTVDDASKYDTSIAPNSNAKIRYKIERYITSYVDITANQSQFIQLSSQGASITYRITFSLKNNRESFDPLGFNWQFIFSSSNTF